jgi:hypothetical protein
MRVGVPAGEAGTGASRLWRVTNSTLERRGDHGYLEVGSDRGGRSRRL